MTMMNSGTDGRINVLFYSEPHPIRNSYTEHMHIASKLAPVLIESVRRKQICLRILSNNDMVDRMSAEHPATIGFLQRPTNEESCRINALFGPWSDEAITRWLELVRGEGEVTRLYLDILERLHGEQPIDVILIWSENGAVRRFAKRHGIPVLSGELGPTRSPFPQTLYFDPQGTNGHASHRKAMRRLIEKTRTADGSFLPASTWLISNERSNGAPETVCSLIDRSATHGSGLIAKLPERPYLYVPLQLADDLNTLLHSEFRGPIEFLRVVVQKARENGYGLVVKGHPAVKSRPYNLQHEIEALEWLSAHVPEAVVLPRDCGSDCSAYFMGNAAYTVSVNSSVGFESMMLGVPALVLGQAAYDADGWLQENIPLLPSDQPRDLREPMDALVSSHLDHVLVPNDMVFETDYLYRRLSALAAGRDRPLSDFRFSDWYVCGEVFDPCPPALPRASALGQELVSPGSKVTLEDGVAAFANPAASEEVTLELGDHCIGYIDSMEKIDEAGQFRIGGWVLERERQVPPQAIYVLSGNQVLSCHHPAVRRDDVARAYPDLASIPRCGFGLSFTVPDIANTQLLMQTSDGKGQLVPRIFERAMIGTQPKAAKTIPSGLKTTGEETRKNPQFRLLNRSEETPPERTYIVIGMGRSGTSFIASVLDWLGVFLGDQPTARTLEDARLGRLMDACDFQQANEVIADYNRRYSIWGYKRPSMLLHAAQNEGMFRNPHYIFAHRDFFGIALRNEMAISRDITESIRKCVNASAHVYDLMETTKVPSLHLSFELVKGDQLRAAEIIRDFVHPEKAGTPLDTPAFTAFIDDRLKIYLK